MKESCRQKKQFVISTLGRNLLRAELQISHEGRNDNLPNVMFGLSSQGPTGTLVSLNSWARIKRLGNFKVTGLCRPTRRGEGLGVKGCLAARSG